ncbi:MAG: MFS transporter [Gammaproteobacteria bacterium]|nr:MAG: MFS transporter [Gammaproteobacteria bacterium]RKZ39063.1 MAG: MFS transporter [Gammaproteobacteria bacterium]RKZ76452.1 MAG: MFS transporter [Gammaproteobacteria bacterium]
MTPTERRATIALASIMSMRMLGLFMIFPVFALYAQDLPSVTPLLVGLAIGIYGLTQGILQIPFGMLSDRIGRKPIIYIGLSIFVFGSIIAALSTSIIGIIIGRALQGCGAISSTVLALTADLTREEHRTKAMAILGMSIGASFIFALVAGPLCYQWIGMSGIFWFTAILASVGIVILYRTIPQPPTCSFHRDTTPALAQFKRVLQDTQLLRIDIGIFVLHLLLTSMFVVLPIALLDNQVDVAHHWQVYVSVLMASIIVMVPLIIIAEKYRHLKLIFVGAIGLLGLSQVGLSYFHQSLTGIIIMLFFFFTAVNLLEASLPSLVSKLAPTESKGTAMGVYSSSQFFGAFFGGVGGGWLHQHYSIGAVFGFCAILTIIWFILAATMRHPNYLSSHLLKIGQLNKKQANQLTQCLMQVPGVAEVMVIIDEEVAYLKVDRKILEPAALDKCAAVCC